MAHRIGSRWSVLAAITLLAGARWLLMYTPDHFTPWLPGAWFTGAWYGVTRAALNVGNCWLLLVLVPLVLVLWLGRQEPRPVAAWLRTGRPQLGSRRARWGVVLLRLGGAGIGFGAARWIDAVRASYPIVKAAGQSPGLLLLSRLLTLALLLATELCYRGVALTVLEEAAGRSAVYPLAAVYALDHLGASEAEVVASLFAGILLGHLALWVRSIWPGFTAHALCALSVDLTSLYAGE